MAYIIAEPFLTANRIRFSSASFAEAVWDVQLANQGEVVFITNVKP